MSVRKGYKQTEIGVIPEEWEVVEIGEYCDILDSKRIPLSSTVRAEMQGDIPYYGANGVLDYINDYIFDEELVLLAEDGGNFNEYETRPIAYMITGKSWVNNHAHILRAKNGQNHFLFYSLVHKNITAYINGGTRAKLNRSELVKIPIANPPLQEQRKIATILSSVDNKIEAIDERIAQTEMLKKGLMQKLLHDGIGHTEFKESEIGRIPKEWEVVNVGKHIELMGGYAFKSKDAKEFGTKWLKIANVGINTIKWEQISYLQDDYKEKYKKFLLKKGDIVLAMTRPILNMKLKIAKITDSDLPALLNQRVGKLIFDNNINSNFVYQVLQHTDFVKLLMLKIMGTDPPNVSSEQFESIKIPLPSPLEQQKIATILSSTDNKLDTLREKKARYEQLKKGLMQKLLTGEIRTIP